MTTRYQNEHYEDAARIVASFVRIRMTVPGGATGDEMAAAFADLFAADNPTYCVQCGQPAGTPYVFCFSWYDGHSWKGGFDPEQFLAACGLESEG